MKPLKIYQARTLFEGKVIGKEGYYVAIPNKFKNCRIKVNYGGKEMMVEKWLNAVAYRKFPDKYGRKDANGNTAQYTLGYFKWNPIIEKTMIQQWQDE